MLFRFCTKNAKNKHSLKEKGGGGEGERVRERDNSDCIAYEKTGIRINFFHYLRMNFRNKNRD